MVCAPPRVLPRSLDSVWLARGGGPVPVPPYLAWPARPAGAACRRGWSGAVPEGGWPATVVRGVWCQAMSLPRPPVLCGSQSGYRDPCVPGAVGAGVGTQQRFHSVRPCGPALLAVGVARGGPGGGAFHRCEGRLRSGAPPPPTAHPLRGLLGSVTHRLWARACGCGGPSLPLWPACLVGAACRGGGGGPSPGGWPATVARGVWCHALSLRLPPVIRGGRPESRDLCVRGAAPQRAPLRAGVARCGDGGRASAGGGAFHRCEGRLRSGAPPHPTARPLGGLLRSATHVLWARACGCGGPTLSPWPARPVGAACRGVGGGPSPGGGGWPATVVRGVWCQALSLPRPLVLCGRQPGYRNPCVPGAVGAGVGTQHRFHSVRPWGPALLAVRVAEGRPRGGCLPPL